MKAKIQIECESGEPLAEILTFLARQPLSKLHVDFEEEKRKSSKPLLRDAVMAQFPAAPPPLPVLFGPKRGRPRSKDILMHALQERGPTPRRELLQLAKQHDHTTNAMDWAIRDLQERGEIVSENDVVRLANGEALPQARPLSGIEVILDLLSDGGEHPRDELRRGFGRTGLKPKGFDARLSDAIARGLVERVGENLFRRVNASLPSPA